MFLHAWATAPLVWIALRVAGYRGCLRLLRALSVVRAPVPPHGGDAARVARLVRAAARHGLVARHCLTESLTLWWLLRRRGIESDLRFGVRRHGAGLDAHAWVEVDGMPLDERPDVGRAFAPLARSTAV